MRVLVQAEQCDRKGVWHPVGEPVEMDSADVAVWLPPGRVRVRFTTATGTEQVTDSILNVRARTVRLGDGTRRGRGKG